MQWRHIGISLALLTLAGVSVARAQSREETFRAWDTNHDGRLDMDEYKAHGGHPGNFNAMDCNHDGYLDLNEFVNRYQCGSDNATAQPAAPPVAPAPQVNTPPVPSHPSVMESRSARFDQLDRNHDGVLTRDEWRGESVPFRIADRNGDGVVTRDEYLSLYDGNRGVYNGANSVDALLRRFDALDRNHDGVLTRSEWRGESVPFRTADRDGDGVVTRDEYLSLYGYGDTYGNYGNNGNNGNNGNYVNSGYGNDGAYGAGSAQARAQRFAYLDRYGKGAITRAEWQDEPAAFDILDRNHDGVVTRSEYLDRSYLAGLFRSWDRNGDGVLTRGEWRSSRSLFDRLDTNHDGVVSLDEFLAL